MRLRLFYLITLLFWFKLCVQALFGSFGDPGGAPLGTQGVRLGQGGMLSLGRGPEETQGGVAIRRECLNRVAPAVPRRVGKL